MTIIDWIEESVPRMRRGSQLLDIAYNIEFAKCSEQSALNLSICSATSGRTLRLFGVDEKHHVRAATI